MSGYSGSTVTSRSQSRDSDENGIDDESGTGSGGFSLGVMRNDSSFKSRGSTLTAGSGGETEQSTSESSTGSQQIDTPSSSSEVASPESAEPREVIYLSD